MAGLSDFTPWLGVFETLRVIKGRPIFEPEHRAELLRAAEVLGLKVDFNFDESRAALPPRSGRLRWIVTPRETQAIFNQEDEPDTTPIKINVSPVRVGSQNWDARYKTLSYLSHAQAAQLAGSEDAVLLNEHGQIASAARSNIFWRRGDRIATPAHECGCRRGVVRNFVLKNAKVQEDNYLLHELLEADEIFVTSSIKGIVSVHAIDGRTFKKFPTADQLRQQYAKAVEVQLQ